jgi:hypothetical protein
VDDSQRWAVCDGAPMAGKADGVDRLRTLLVMQWLYLRVQLWSIEMLVHTRAAWQLKAAAHRAQQQQSGTESGSKLSASKAETTMEQSMMGVTSPLLRSVEGIKVGDGNAHGTVGRLEPRVTGRQMVGSGTVGRGTRCGLGIFLGGPWARQPQAGLTQG